MMECFIMYAAVNLPNKFKYSIHFNKTHVLYKTRMLIHFESRKPQVKPNPPVGDDATWMLSWPFREPQNLFSLLFFLLASLPPFLSFYLLFLIVFSSILHAGLAKPIDLCRKAMILLSPWAN